MRAIDLCKHRNLEQAIDNAFMKTDQILGAGSAACFYPVEKCCAFILSVFIESFQNPVTGKNALAKQERV
ncbi:MAG: hypothetical protein ACOYKJ_01270 [Candidatus Howiella sp.]